MKIYVSQIYIEVGINYPFSHVFQKWIGKELTKRVQPSEAFVKTYSEDFSLIFRMSAKSKLIEPEIRGPTLFKRAKDVEFTIFLPHNGRQSTKPDDLRQPVSLLLNSIVNVLQRFGMDTSQILKDSSALVEHVISDPSMIVSVE